MKDSIPPSTNASSRQAKRLKKLFRTNKPLYYDNLCNFIPISVSCFGSGSLEHRGVAKGIISLFNIYFRNGELVDEIEREEIGWFGMGRYYLANVSFCHFVFVLLIF